MNIKLSLSKIRFKQFFLLAPVVYLLITFLSCSGNDKNTDFVSDTGYILLDSQVIGPTGGEINLDSIIVKIPSGAFNDNTELSVYVGEENDGFDEYAKSSLFQISGLPASVNKPVSLKLKYNGTLSGDTLVAIGNVKYAVSLDSTLFSYESEIAKDSSGYLIYELPAFSNLNKAKSFNENSSPNRVNIVILNDNTTFNSSNGRFVVTCPMQFVQQGIKLGEYLEDSYNMCFALGFDLSPRDWANHPVEVFARSIQYSGYYENPGASNMTDAHLISWINDGTFTIGFNVLQNDNYLQTTCIHEFLHLVQNLYEFSAPDIKEEQFWLMEATSVWIEETVSDESDYVSYSFDGKEMYPFEGWQFGGRTSSRDYNKYAKQGYGLSVLIKGLVDLYGYESIVTIFDAIKAGTLPTDPTDPVDAVLSVITHPIGVFWHNLLSWYTLGGAYNSEVNYKFLNNDVSYKATVLIDPSYSSQSLKLGYHDLSGKLFKVQSGDISSLTELPLSFSVDDTENCGILVCKFKQGYDIASIGEVLPGGTGIVALDDVKPIFDEGYELVVLVTNSSYNKNSNYQAVHDVELIIERPIEIEKVDFRIQCEGSYSTNTNLYWANPGVDTTYFYDSRVTITPHSDLFTQNVNVAGNTITLIIDETEPAGDGNYTYQTFLVMEVDNIENPTIVKNFMCNDVVIYQDSNTDTRAEKTASGVNIPLINNSPPLRFDVSGNVSTNLNAFSHDFIGDYRIYNPRGYENTNMLSYNGAVDGKIFFDIYFGE